MSLLTPRTRRSMRNRMVALSEFLRESLSRIQEVIAGATGSLVVMAIVAGVPVALLFLAWLVHRRLRPIEVGVGLTFNHPPLWKPGGLYVFLIVSRPRTRTPSLANEGLTEISIRCLAGTDISDTQVSAKNWNAWIDDETKTVKAQGQPTLADVLVRFHDGPHDQGYTLRPMLLKYSYQYRGWMRHVSGLLRTYPREKTGAIKVPTPYPRLGAAVRPDIGDINKYRSHEEDLTKGIGQ